MSNIELYCSYVDVDEEKAEEIYKFLDSNIKLIFLEIQKLKQNIFNRFSKETKFEISLNLVSDNEIAEVNNSWRGLQMPTNVLSMAVDDLAVDLAVDNSFMLGEIVISLETAEKEAKEDNIAVFGHSIRLFIHGFLHIVGFDHEVEEEAIEMFNLENKILEKLDFEIKGLTKNFWEEN